MPNVKRSACFGGRQGSFSSTSALTFFGFPLSGTCQAPPMPLPAGDGRAEAEQISRRKPSTALATSSSTRRRSNVADCGIRRQQLRRYSSRGCAGSPVLPRFAGYPAPSDQGLPLSIRTEDTYEDWVRRVNVETEQRRGCSGTARRKGDNRQTEPTATAPHFDSTGSASSISDAVVRPRSCRGRRAVGVNGRYRELPSA